MLAKTIPFYFRQPTLAQVSIDELKRAVDKYPYSSTLQLLLLKKMQQENDLGQISQWEKCSVYFPNPFLLQATLDGYGMPTTLPEIPVVTGNQQAEEEEEIPLVGKIGISQAAVVETPTVAAVEEVPTTATVDETLATEAIEEPALEPAQATTVVVEKEPADDIVPNLSAEELEESRTEPADYIVANISSDELEEATAEAPAEADHQAEFDHETLPEANHEGEADTEDLRTELLLRESPIPIPSLKDLQPDISDQPLFEPYHTIDYFASQGIRLSNDLPADDKLGRQMKSFTAWIRSMKKLPQAGLEQKLAETARGGEHIVAMAAGSIKPQEVTTETMAEVFVKQGNIAKAVDIYQKLSLAYPHKSVYFASRIEQLKKD
ncbi:MAG: hypothetical protein LCH51_08020 [Bacteroidetes bacterium]|nr:hypothetical protein [Bacteroidota bacterium]HOA37392.1 hypothetical protein [Flavihumibacter sp.]